MIDLLEIQTYPDIKGLPMIGIIGYHDYN